MQKPINIPIIANGDGFVHEDILKMREMTGSDSIMIARGAIKNTSIFQPTPIPIYDIMQEYMKIAIQTDNHYTNTKYTILQMAKEHGMWQNNGEGEGQIIHKGKSTRVIAGLFNLEDYYDQFQKEYLTKQNGNTFVGGLKHDEVEGVSEKEERPKKRQKIVNENSENKAKS